MKILFVTAEPEGCILNGVGKYVWDLARELKKTLDVKIMSLQLDPFINFEESIKVASSDLKADYSFKVDYDYYTEDIEARYLLAVHKALPFVNEVLKSFSPDIIYLQGPKVYLPFRNCKNIIIAFHGLTKDIVFPDPPNALDVAEMNWEIEASKRAKVVVFFSKYMLKRFESVYQIKCNTCVLPLGIKNTDYFYDKSNSEFIVSYFGRLDNKVKGYSCFLDAVKSLPEKTKDGKKISFHVFGDGENVDKAKYDNVEFHGQVSGSDLYKAYSQTNIVVMPSLYEPFGYVGLEAMASGCILLATKGLGMDEYLDPEKNSIIIEPSKDSIVKAIEAVIEKTDSYLPLTNLAMQTAEKWSFDNSLKSHISFFENEIKNILEINNEVNKTV